MPLEPLGQYTQLLSEWLLGISLIHRENKNKTTEKVYRLFQTSLRLSFYLRRSWGRAYVSKTTRLRICSSSDVRAVLNVCVLDAVRIVMPPPPWESVRIVGAVISYRNNSYTTAESTEITRNCVRGENDLLRPSAIHALPWPRPTVPKSTAVFLSASDLPVRLATHPQPASESVSVYIVSCPGLLTRRCKSYQNTLTCRS